MQGGRASLRDVARLAGVAISSASRVLSNHPEVSPSMRLRVLAAVEQLGYEPDFLARSLRSGDTLTVGLVVPTHSDAMVGEVALGAEMALRVKGYTMIVLNSEWDSEVDAEHIRLLERRRVDGAVVSVVDESDPRALRYLRELSVPVVQLERDSFDRETSSSFVHVDHETATREVIAHLAGLGHRVIGLVVGTPVIRPDREVARAFIRACLESGIEAIVEHGPQLPEHGLTAANKMLDAASRPTAIVSSSNEFFPGVLRCVRERRLKIPRDISLVTFDDMRLLDLLEPPIDVVRRPARAAGRAAGELLLERLAGEPARSVLIGSEFIPRGSSGPPRTSAQVKRSPLTVAKLQSVAASEQQLPGARLS